jgi:ERCC4-related helicase
MKREQARRSGKTYCTEELKSLYSSSETIFQELGPHIAQWFVQTCITRFLSKSSNSFQQNTASTNEERLHLIGLLGKLDMPGPETATMNSPKVDSLIQILQEEWVPGLPGMIFVQKRVTVQALTELLSSHPLFSETLNVEAVVGASSHAKRKKKITDLIELNHNPSLDDFRSGKKNLVIATNVLSEGIDMPTCHLVICFDQPDNIVSFMQKRGRARKKGSKYILMAPKVDPSNRHDWEQLERKLEDAYMNGVKETSIQSILESREEKGYREFVVKETG